MPYKRGKLKGQLTTAEIRKLISAHNKLSKITIPPRSTREQIMDILDKNGFSVDHEKELLVQKTAKKMDINLEKAKEVTKRQPKAQPKKKVLAIEDKPVDSSAVKSIMKSLEKELSKLETFIKTRISDKSDKEPLGMTFKESMDQDLQSTKNKFMDRLEDLNPKERKRIIKFMDDSWKELFSKYKSQAKLIEKEVKEEKKKPVKKPKADKGFKINRSQRTKLLNEWNDERFGAGLKRVKLHPILDMKASEETPALVKQKCKELRLRYHPDKNNEPNQEKFDMVQRACKILLDTQEITK